MGGDQPIHERTTGTDLETSVIERAEKEVMARMKERTERPSQRIRGSRRTLATHWLAIFNVFSLLFVAGTILAPWLRANGYTHPAAFLYGFYHLQCLQRPGHSFVLFGEEMAMEQRMVAIYAGWLLAGSIFVVLRRKLRPVSYAVLVALSLPMVFDVASQMIGLRGGTWQLRIATGVLFALGGAWWAFPRMEVRARASASRWATATSA